ncbi:MAG TPA: D-alanyl-D-alanine carboxypeptidase family protein [Kofleriaceae bacterium]|nr:D-alanyl-D-alanine carboxypeptidase family protein [Kofleriaceae bacterium]
MRALLIGILSWACFTTAAEARTVTGYSHGQKTRIRLVEVSGVEVEAATARAFKTMARAARKAGLEIGIRSGFRSQEKQKLLYTEYRKGWGHLAARPGYSNHQSGRALDIYITDYRVYEWLKQHAAKFGFRRTVRNEAWHWEYVGGGETAQARRAK